MRSPIIVLSMVLMSAQALSDENRTLADQFLNPAAATRILPIKHVLPVEPDQQDAALEQLAARGFGGMATNVSFKDYMRSEEQWEGWLRAVRKSHGMGMSLWLYDEKGYPSGNAGGLTMENNPEWEARGLMVSQTETPGGVTTLVCPPGALFLAAAFPEKSGTPLLDEAVDVRDKIQDGQLSWDAPEGSWRIMVITEGPLYEGTHAAVSLADKLPYVNLLLPEPTKRFIEVTHDVYAARLGNDLSRYFVSTFTDEPSLMSMYFQPQPWSVLPWSENLPLEFEKRRGYALAPVVPLLACGNTSECSKVRLDFWTTVGELVSENYFGQIRTWCRQHNLLSGGHLLCEEPILTHVPLYGNFFQCLRQLDAPSMDCLTSIPGEVNWQVGRLISSVADICGYAVTMSESSDHSQRWRAPGDDRPKRMVTESEIRGSFNRLMVSGITTFTSYYSFEGLTDEQCLRLNEWVGRCSTLLRSGRQVADIAVVYPAETLASRYAASRHWVRDAPPAAHQVQRMYELVSESFFLAGRDFTYVDGQGLAEATVDEGRLHLNGLSWSVVVLPCVDTLPFAAWEKLYAFWKSGGAVIALGDLPANSEKAFPDPRVQSMADDLFGSDPSGHVHGNPMGGVGIVLRYDQEALLNRIVDACAPPHVHIPRGAPLRTTHRHMQERHVYFVINDSPEPWTGEIALPGAESLQQWAPASGEIHPLADPSKIPLQLEPYGGVLFCSDRFTAPKAGVPEREHAAEMETHPLPSVPPTVARGEFVAEQMQASGDGARWTVSGTLTQSDVDTFLFLTFSWQEAISVEEVEFIVFDVSIPSGQHCPQTLLLIACDAAGVEYVADTRMLLNIPGEFRLCIPLKHFGRAPWSKGTDGQFNWSQLRDMRIGWGGYLGAKDEIISFTAAAPSTVKLN